MWCAEKMLEDACAAMARLVRVRAVRLVSRRVVTSGNLMRRCLVGATVFFVVLVAGCSPESVELSTTSSILVSPVSSTSAPPSSLSSTVTPPLSTPSESVIVAVGETLELVVDSPELVVAPGVLDGVDLDAGLPEGGVVTPVDGMLVVSGDVAEMLVDVSLPDGQMDRFVVVMVKDADRWLVVYTVLVP